MSTPASFYWFDYETFGTQAAWDRPCQFAGLRTDTDLNEIDDPLVVYCRQSMDYLPNPGACRVTGLTPQHVNSKGVCESDFIQQILAQIGLAQTCSLGYNSIRFDDEFTRYTLFRNFLDPYEHEYKNGCSRWDLLDVVRLTRALRPEGIQWPTNDDGTPTNRLELLSAANGIEHGHAHDALSDVRATIGMAKLIRQEQPRLFNYAFEHRTKQALSELLSVSRSRVSLLVSSMIPASRSHIAAILPLALHPDNRNSVIVLDLDEDPTALLSMNADEIAQQLFNKDTGQSNNNHAKSRPGLRTVAINKCPVVVPLNTLRKEDENRLEMNLTRIQEHATIARKLTAPDMQQKIISAMTRTWPESHTDVEGSLYSGSFLSQADRQRCEELRQCDPKDIVDIGAHFEDRRMVELAWRYQARNHPDSMHSQTRSQWQDYCRTRLNSESTPWLGFEQFDSLMAELAWSPEQDTLRQELKQYRDSVYEFSEFGN